MNEVNKEQEFIDNVWKKAHYLEHQRYKDEEALRKKETLMKKKKNKWLLGLSIGLLIVLLPLIAFKTLDFVFIILVGICLLSFSSYYEHYFLSHQK